MENQSLLRTLAVTANSYASANGLQIEKKHSDGTSYFEAAPISLLPNAYPETAFQQAVDLAPIFNILVDRVSRDASFLQETLSGVKDADPFTAKLLELYQDIYLDPSNMALQADRLGIHRSDYMLHRGIVQQIELNTIASSFGSLACKVAALHSFLVSRFDCDDLQAFLKENQKAVGAGDARGRVPPNPALQRLPASMATVVRRYQERYQVQPIILFVVQPGESNTVDQRMLEFGLWQDHSIPVVRLSLADCHEHVVRSTDGALLYDGQEIALVYYRAGYAPTDYPDGYQGVEWKAREIMERGRAAKAPCLGYHLAGTKKVQQQLARPGVLERFFPQDSKAVEGMRKAFAGLYSLGDDVTESDLHAVHDVLNGAHGKYVLKPQREGGGYNFYGDTLAAKLRENVQQTSMGLVLDKKLNEYILMERLFPPQQTAILLRSGKVEGSGDTVSELGCYGTIVVDAEGQIIQNEYAGFLLRTKFSNVDEGGVASGFATLSSPYLC